MGHTIQGLVAQRSLWAGLPSLPDGGGLVPLRGPFAIYVPHPEEREDLDEIAPGLAELGLQLSRSGPVALIATCYFGGIGEQMAAAWSQGNVLLAQSRGPGGIINAALRAIGVVGINALDEFDTLGLGWYRSNEAWLEFAAHGKCAWQRESWPDAEAAWKSWRNDMPLNRGHDHG